MRLDLARAPRLVHAAGCACGLCRPLGPRFAAAARRLVLGRGESAEAYVTSLGLRAAGIAIALVPARAIVAAPSKMRRGLTLYEQELQAALQLALLAMECQRDALLEVGCIVIDGAPDLSTLEPDLAPEIAALDASIAAGRAALGLPSLPKGAPSHG